MALTINCLIYYPEERKEKRKKKKEKSVKLLVRIIPSFDTPTLHAIFGKTQSLLLFESVRHELDWKWGFHVSY